MNTNRDLLKRLLRLFPVKVVKDKFNLTGVSADIIEQITGRQEADQTVRDFAADNYTYTKQHIYLYQSDRQFLNGSMTNFPLDVVKQANANGVRTYFCFATIEYSVILSNPLQNAQLRFFQPVMIRFIGDVIVIHFTKLEKNVATFFPADRNAIRTGQVSHEADTLEEIVTFLSNSYTLAPLDINRGIKHLWHNDWIDCRKVQWRRNNSIATEAMDEQYLYKQESPNEYADTITRPLVKTSFKYLEGDDYFCEDFDADPGNGHINIPKFPKDENQVLNVVREILTNN